MSNVMKDVLELIVGISPRRKYPSTRTRNYFAVPGMFFSPNYNFNSIATITMKYLFFLQNSLNDGLIDELNLSKNISMCIDFSERHDSRKCWILHVLRNTFQSWTQRRNNTSTLQTRAATWRHMLTHPWDWASNFTYLVCNTTTMMYRQKWVVYRPCEQFAQTIFLSICFPIHLTNWVWVYCNVCKLLLLCVNLADHPKYAYKYALHTENTKYVTTSTSLEISL